ncbi:MAG: hypothetical protein ACYC27_21860 [Armatimonadota bacterium]
MNRSRNVILITALIFSALVLLFGIPLMLGMISPDSIFGSVIPNAAHNTDIWYDICAYTGNAYVLAALLTGLLSITAYFIRRINNLLYLIIIIILILVTVAVPALMTMGFVRSLNLT